MESKKNTFQIVLIGILTVLVLILAAALYRSWRVEGELRAQLAEAQNNAMTVENEQGTQLAAAADNALTVRVMNGILQQQDASGQWLDVAPVEELRQADPVLAGRTKMENLIAQDEEKISPILSKQSVFMGASLARASQVQSTAEKTTIQQTKPTNATTTVTAPIATPVPTAQPAIGGSSDSGSSDSGSSDSGSSDSGSSDSGSSDSGNSGESSSGSGSSSGDGEDIGWTDEVL